MYIAANAKINLCLDITGVRPDGYHEVSMVMQELKLHDDINIIPNDTGRISLKVSRQSVLTPPPVTAGTANDGNSAETEAACLNVPTGQKKADGHTFPAVPADEHNLMWRAAELMRSACGIRHGYDMELVKRIPSEAGLGGGSSDAAAVLKAINSLSGVNASSQELMRLGAGLGADVPFFINGGTALCEGIGELITGLNTITGVHVLLIKPLAGMSTPAVYKAYDTLTMQPGLKSSGRPDVRSAVMALNTGNYNALCKSVGNVLEPPVLESLPVIGDIKRKLLEFGADAACMTGSGSVVFGLFRDENTMQLCGNAVLSAPYAAALSGVTETEFAE